MDFMNTKTIKQTIVDILKVKGELAYDEIYNEIIKLNLYDFGAKNPISVLKIEIKRSAENTIYSKPYKEKLFQITANNKIKLL